MGRIKSRAIKKVAFQLLKQHPEVFKDTFEENKALILNYLEQPSKRLRNPIAGYITRLIQNQKQGKRIIGL